MRTGAVSLKEQPRLPLSTKLYTLVVALLPVLATYASGIPGFSVGDVCLILFTLYALLHPQRRQNNQFSTSVRTLSWGLVLIVLFDVIALTFTQEYVSNVIIRTIRYTFYIFCFLFTSKRLIDIDLLKKYVKNTAIAASAYIFVQFIAYRLFNRILLGFLPFLKLYVTDYATQNYEAMYSMMYRPTSFFYEPTHFARYAILGLAIILWMPNLKVKDVFAALFVTFGIFFSTSSQGYLLLVLVWVAFALTRMGKVKNNAIKIIGGFCIIAAPFLLYYVFQLPFVQETLQRSLSGSISDSTSAVGARLGGYALYGSLPLFHKIFGMGFGVVPDSEWFSSAAYWLYGSGIIVFAIYVIFTIGSIFRLKGEQKLIMMIVFVLFFLDDSFYSYMCVLFYSLTLLTRREEVVVREQAPLYRQRIPIRQRYLH